MRNFEQYFHCAADRDGLVTMRKYPEFQYAGDMLCALEIELNKGKHRFHLLMKDGSERTVNIHHLGEDDITIADENMDICGGFEDSELVSFLTAE